MRQPCHIKRKIHALSRPSFRPAAGVLAQGLLQCLAVVAPQPRLGFVRVLAANHSSGHPALRIRMANALRQTLPEFLMATAKSDPLTKFIAERQDTENMRTFRLAS